MYKQSLIAFTLVLSACGGGGNSSSNNHNTPNGSIDDPTNANVNTSEITLFFGDPIHGATYRVENFTHSFDDKRTPEMTVTEKDAVAGSEIDIIWWTHAKNASDQTLDTYQYEAEVYLSNDEQLDSLDQKLFSLSCDAPILTNDQNPCGSQGYVRCVYADSHNPTLTCLTVPPNASDGFSDRVIDISSYFSLGNPTPVNFITKLCLSNEITDCITKVADMTLY